MYLQSALGWSATSSGLSLMILMVTLNASAGLSSQLIGRVKHYKLLAEHLSGHRHRAIAGVVVLGRRTMTPLQI